MKTNNNVLFCIFVISITVLLFRYNVNAQINLSELKVGNQSDGSILVPTNQLLRPAGFQIYLPGRPVDIAISPDQKWLAVKNFDALNLIQIQDRTILQTLPLGRSGASFTGICFSDDGRKIYLTEAGDRIHIASMSDLNILHWEKPVMLPSPAIGGDPVPGGLVVDEENQEIYVTLSRNNSLAAISLQDTTIIEIPVGIAPYDVVLATPTKAYITNWGGRRPHQGESTYNSSGSQVLVDPETGVANNGAVSVVDLAARKEIKSIEVGLHPSGIVMSHDKKRVAVACANSDIVSLIDTEWDEVVEKISVRLSKQLPFGSAPNSLAFSPDDKYLYIANGTDNAICVVQIGNPGKIMGYIPTGWYPGSVILDQDARFLYVSNIKGIGSRNQRTDRKGFNSHDHLGTVSIIPIPNHQELKEMTRVVEENNSLNKMMEELVTEQKVKKQVAIPQFPGQVSHIKHVVYIIKENRTYDQVFGDLPQGDGDPDLVYFGRKVTPNHHALAETYVLLDNFYCSGILSADGHQWTDEAYVTDYVEKFFGDFTRSYPYDGDDALAYASSGFIWDNVLRHGLTFRDYGEFVKAIIEPKDATFTDHYNDFLAGTNHVKIRAKANLEQLSPYLCPTYIGFPNTVSDVYRAREFIKELKEFEKNDNFPNFTIMLLPNDHTSGTRPGRPTPRAAVADNDLALGQVVEAITECKFWKETCIFVTEDDPQDGLDHIDGHRTVGLVISPYTKRGEVISTYFTQINMVRTIENILGIPPMNQFDLAAEPMMDCFSEHPDYKPYKAIPSNIPLDELNPPLHSLSGDKLYWAQKSLEQDLKDVDKIDEDVFNWILWHAIKGYDVPYPDSDEGNE